MYPLLGVKWFLAVMMEKLFEIIGTFSNSKGSENHQFIASLLATWKLQGKNMSDELESLLRRELCQ